MIINPRILLIIVAIGVAIYFTQKSNNTDESIEKVAQTETTVEEISPKPKSSGELMSDSITAVNFPDKELERCVFDEIKEGSDSANKKNVANLTKLQCNAYKITSLEGVEKLSSLKEVTIIGSDIQDATPLSRINTLTNIYLKGGNENIQNIDSLAQLSNLKKISFPHMLQTYCYEAKTVLKSMKENIEGPTSNNLSLMHCRGKKTYKVTSALMKERDGDPLTSEESAALDDYHANLDWSGENN